MDHWPAPCLLGEKAPFFQWGMGKELLRPGPPAQSHSLACPTTLNRMPLSTDTMLL